jgi:hypothetical protein
MYSEKAKHLLLSGLEGKLLAHVRDVLRELAQPELHVLKPSAVLECLQPALVQPAITGFI